ncbi:MAG: IS21-like element helper ATPase IstB [Chloroflexota bacterium]
MLTQPLLDKLIQLRLPAFHDGLQEQINNPKYIELSFEERLALLVDMEITRRHDRRIQRLIKLAAFPQSATLEDLDLSASRGLERRFVLELAQGNWIDQHLNILVLGPTGSGKSFLSCVLGFAACRTNHSVRYFRTSRLLFQLAQSHLDGSFPLLLASLAKIDLLILDDWMRDPISASETRDLLEILDDRFGRVSTLVASQVPVGDWFSRFPDPTHADAILDRVIHNAYRLNLTGDSQRKVRSPIPMSST